MLWVMSIPGGKQQKHKPAKGGCIACSLARLDRLVWFWVFISLWNWKTSWPKHQLDLLNISTTVDLPLANLNCFIQLGRGQDKTSYFHYTALLMYSSAAFVMVSSHCLTSAVVWQVFWSLSVWPSGWWAYEAWTLVFIWGWMRKVNSMGR